MVKTPKEKWGFVALSTALILALLISLISYTDLEAALLDQYRRQQDSQTELAAFNLEHHILQVSRDLTELSKYQVLQRLAFNNCSGQATFPMLNSKSKIDNILLTNSSGTVVACNEAAYQDLLGLNIQNKVYYQQPLQTKQVFVSQLVRQGPAQEIVVSAPVYKGEESPYPAVRGEFTGILFSVINTEELFFRYVYPIALPQRNQYWIISQRTNEIISQSVEIPPGGLSEVPTASQGQSGILSYADLQAGTDNWRLLVYTPKEHVSTVLRDVRLRHRMSLWLVLAALLGAGIYAYMLYRSKLSVQITLERAKTTLDTIGIKIDAQEATLQLQPKQAYLVKDKPYQVHHLFRQLSTKRSLVFTVDSSFVNRNSTVVHIPQTIKNLERALPMIKAFIEQGASTILIDDLSALDWELTQIEKLRDLIATSESMALIGIQHISSYKELENCLVDLYGKKLTSTDLTQREKDILHYLNDQTQQNRLVVFSDISKQFKITKPTTRSQINHLALKGLIVVDQRGRYKTIKLTLRGKKLL